MPAIRPSKLVEKYVDEVRTLDDGTRIVTPASNRKLLVNGLGYQITISSDGLVRIQTQDGITRRLVAMNWHSSSIAFATSLNGNYALFSGARMYPEARVFLDTLKESVLIITEATSENNTPSAKSEMIETLGHSLRVTRSRVTSVQRQLLEASEPERFRALEDSALAFLRMRKSTPRSKTAHYKGETGMLVDAVLVLVAVTQGTHASVPKITSYAERDEHALLMERHPFRLAFVRAQKAGTVDEMPIMISIRRAFEVYSPRTPMFSEMFGTPHNMNSEIVGGIGVLSLVLANGDFNGATSITNGNLPSLPLATFHRRWNALGKPNRGACKRSVRELLHWLIEQPNMGHLVESYRPWRSKARELLSMSPAGTLYPESGTNNPRATSSSSSMSPAGTLYPESGTHNPRATSSSIPSMSPAGTDYPESGTANPRATSSSIPSMSPAGTPYPESGTINPRATPPL